MTSVNTESLLQLSTRVLRDLADGHSVQRLAVFLCSEAERLTQHRVATLFRLGVDGRLQVFATTTAVSEEQARLHEAIRQEIVDQHCSVLDCQHALVVDQNFAPKKCTMQCILSDHAHGSCWAYPVYESDTGYFCALLTKEHSTLRARYTTARPDSIYRGHAVVF